jgi:3-oxoacyl-(acyl-carrier-protein) synthase
LPGFISSPFSPLVAEAAERCLRRRYGEPPASPERGDRTAVIIVSTSGDTATAANLADAVDSGRRVAPLLFFQAVPNAVAGHVAARWGLAGPVVCLAPAIPVSEEDDHEGFAAARLLLRDGDADEALIILVETGVDPGRAAALLCTRPPPT